MPVSSPSLVMVTNGDYVVWRLLEGRLSRESGAYRARAVMS